MNDSFNVRPRGHRRSVAVLMVIFMLISVALPTYAMDGSIKSSSMLGSAALVSPKIAAGVGCHSLALKQDGTVWGWGDNSFGQLGDGTKTNRSTPVQAKALTNITAIAAGAGYSLALKQDGTVWAWGDNNFGQLGNGKITNASTPVQVSNLSGVTAITASLWHSMALKSDSTVWAWGVNEYGQLGDGTKTNRSTPVQVPGLTGVTAIDAGLHHSLVLKQDGTVWSWGSNSRGQLGDGTTTDRYSPVQASNLSSVTMIAAGSHSLALKSDGTVWAWGNNWDGQLGDGTITDRNTPVQVPGLTNITAIAAGGFYSLALKQGGAVWAWGNNDVGQLGDGTGVRRLTPVQARISLASAISPPTNLVATTTASDIHFSWSSAAGASGYNVYRKEVSGAYQKLNTSTVTTTSYKDATAQAGRAYTYYVTAVGADGSESAGSNEVTVSLTTRAFSDISTTAWYKAYIDALVTKEVISGYPDGTFRPLNSITRAEFSKMIILAIGESPSTSAASSFTDVTTSYWAHGYIEKAKELGIINGYPDRTFKPTDTVSRQEIAKMVVLAAKLPLLDFYHGGFADVPQTLWSWSYISAANDAGIVSGYPDKTFKPANLATRAESCKMVYLLMVKYVIH